MARWINRSEGMWLAAIVVAAGVGLGVTAGQSWFYADDVYNLVLADKDGLTAAFLTTDYVGHLAPGHRVLDWTVALAHASWALALSEFLAFWAIGVVAFYVIARRLAGRGFLALAATAMFASSVVFVRTMQWLSSGGHVVPSIALTLVSLAAALHWHETRRGWALALALGAMVAALLFYEKPVLLPVYVAGVLWFVRAPSLRARDLWAAARADAPLIGGMLVIAVGYDVLVKATGYLATGGSTTLDQWESFLRGAWTRGSTPLLIGQQIPQAGATSFNEAMVTLAQAVLLVLVAWSIARRFSAWRAWVFYGVVWALNVAAIGYGRLALYGVLVGLDPRYEAEFAFLIPLTLVLAFVDAEPSGRPVRGLHRVRSAEAAVRRAFARAPALAYLALAPLVALWAASCVNAYHRVEDAWPGHESRVVTERLLAAVDRMEARPGAATPVDRPLPSAVTAGGAERESEWLHVIQPSVRFAPSERGGPRVAAHPGGGTSISAPAATSPPRR